MDLASALDSFLAQNVKGVSVDAKALAAHVIGPPKSYSAASDRGPQAGTAPVELRLPPPGLRYALDVAAFEAALGNVLNDLVFGYVAQLRQSGQIVFTKVWQYAKGPQDKDRELWTADVQMHIASVSKVMTAMAMTVLLADNAISPDTPIINYMPNYWTKGSNIERITFRNLFDHTSGLSAIDLVDFTGTEAAIAGGITLSNLGQYQYHNVNYAVLRVMLGIINGNINKDAYFDPPPLLGLSPQLWNDMAWDYVTANAYAAYLQAKVFGPSGVVGATLDHPAACALAYRGAKDKDRGWDSESLEWACGYAGWHLSINQVLDVMGQFRRGGGILTPAAAQAMLDNGFGVDPLTGNSALPAALTTPAGNVYCKPGNWNNPKNQDEQAVAYFLPDDMELVVLVNSTVGGQLGSTNNLRWVLTQAYVDNLTPVVPVNR
jgi:hypothetical protein